MALKDTRETPHPITLPLVAGYIWGESTYSTWREHGTQDWLLILTLSGAGRIGTERVEAGQAVLLKPNTRHDYGTATHDYGNYVTATDDAPYRQVLPHWEILWTHFLPRPHWHDYLASWPDTGVLTLGSQFETVANLLWQTQTRTRGSQTRRIDFAMTTLEEALLWCDVASPLSAQGKRDPRVVQAIDYLLEHLAEPISLTNLTKAIPLSLSHLNHLFKAQTGLTPQQFLEKERLLHSQQLLERTSYIVFP